MSNKKMPARVATHTADEKVQYQNTRVLKECQLDAFMMCEPQKRKRAILDAIGSSEMTARQIAYKMGFSDLNAVKPRLSEMVRSGDVEVVGKALDKRTDRKVSIYRRKMDVSM